MPVKIGDLKTYLGPFLEGGYNDARQRLAYLREVELIPTGGHGRNAPPFSPTEVGYALMACYPCRAVAAALWVGQFRGLRSMEDPYRGQMLFQDALAAILSDPERASEVDRLTLSAESPRAIIRLIGGREFVYRPPSDAGGGLSFRRELVIGTGLLEQLALDLSEDDSAGAGWTGRSGPGVILPARARARED